MKAHHDDDGTERGCISVAGWKGKSDKETDRDRDNEKGAEESGARAERVASGGFRIAYFRFTSVRANGMLHAAKHRYIIHQQQLEFNLKTVDFIVLGRG